jgi:hypothetical protein
LHEGVDTNYYFWLVLLQSSLHLPSSTKKKPFRRSINVQHILLANMRDESITIHF